MSRDVFILSLDFKQCQIMLERLLVRCYYASNSSSCSVTEFGFFVITLKNPQTLNIGMSTVGLRNYRMGLNGKHFMLRQREAMGSSWGKRTVSKPDLEETRSFVSASISFTFNSGSFGVFVSWHARHAIRIGICFLIHT